jgi:hypothetical protein
MVRVDSPAIRVPFHMVRVASPAMRVPFRVVMHDMVSRRRVVIHDMVSRRRVMCLSGGCGMYLGLISLRQTSIALHRKHVQLFRIFLCQIIMKFQ